MCMGNLTEDVLKVVGTGLDSTGKLGIAKKFRQEGKRAGDKVSGVGKDMGFNPDAPQGTALQGPQQVVEVGAARRNRSLISS